MEEPRKRSPRAPSIPLKEAIDRVLAMYERESRHPVPMDVAAQDLGYKDYSNGRAKIVMASLGYYGLLIRTGEGKVAVARTVEQYKFHPDPLSRRTQEIQWLKAPKVFADLLGKYSERLPSDGALKYDLINMGFTPSAADELLTVFRASVEFTKFFEYSDPSPVAEPDHNQDAGVVETDELDGFNIHDALLTASPSLPRQSSAVLSNVERFSIRLPGGRRAYLELPVDFRVADKEVIKRHLDVLIADDESGGTLSS